MIKLDKQIDTYIIFKLIRQLDKKLCNHLLKDKFQKEINQLEYQLSDQLRESLKND